MADVDQKLVQAALKKQAGGGTLTKTEQRAIDRFQAEQTEKRGLAFVAAVPKKLYSAWSGRQQKILNDQAALYGVPLEGPTVDLRAVVRWLHEFFARHKHVLGELAQGDAAEPTSLRAQLDSERVKQLKKKNQLLEDQVAENRRTLVPRAEIHEYLVRLAGLLRSAGERLEKQHGSAAADVLRGALSDFERIVSELRGATAPGTPPADAGGSRSQ